MPGAKETRFTKTALGKGALSESQLRQALKVLQESDRLGLGLSLEEILVRLGMLTPEQIHEIASSVEEPPPKPSPPPSDKTGTVYGGETLLNFRGGGQAVGPDDADTFLAEPQTRGHTPGYEKGGPVTEQRKADDAPVDVGSRVGPYKIESELGRGGMGVVYKAFDTMLKRHVALKVLIGGEDASEKAIARFHREAESVAKLGHHPGIVPVFDMGRQGRLHYFAMHFVEGKSLTDIIVDGEVTPKRAMVLCEKIANALQFAHQNGVFHRDIKPDNILLDEQGNPSITDFGLAKDVKADSNITVSGTAMGTPQYMPPEQAEGDLEKIDARSDVYSLGATLYHMLTGHPPFDGTSFHNVLVGIMTTEPVPPRKTNPAVPADVQTICLKALEKDPSRRFSSAEEMAQDIRRFLEDQPIQARPASFAYRLSKRVRRNPGLYITSAVATVILIAAAVFFLGIKPALDLRQEERKDTEILELALERRLKPEQKAQALFEKAKTLFYGEKYNGCAAICDELVAEFSPRQGAPALGIPAVRHRRILFSERFRPLRQPFVFPVAQALALKAQALEALGDDKGSLDTWLLAYAKARPSPAPKESAVSGPALVQIGRRLLAMRDIDRATVTFQKFLRAFPDNLDLGRAWFGLGECFWCKGRFALAKEAFERVIAPTALPEEEREALAWYEPRCDRLSHELVVPRPPGGLTITDVDGDGRNELGAYEKDKGFTLYDFTPQGFVARFHIPLARIREAAGSPDYSDMGLRWVKMYGPKKWALLNWRQAGKEKVLWIFPLKPDGTLEQAVHATLPGDAQLFAAADLDGDGTKEIMVAKRNPGGWVKAYRLENGSFTLMGQMELRSYGYIHKVTDLDGDGREEYLINLAEYADWQAWEFRFQGPGKPLLSRRLSPFHFYGGLIAYRAAVGADPPAIWVHNRVTAEQVRVLKSHTDEKFILPSGLFRILPGDTNPPLDYTARFPRKPNVHSGVLPLGDDMMVVHASLANGRRVVGFRPVEFDRRWAMYSPSEAIHTVWSGGFLGKKRHDVLVLHAKTIRIFGAGEAVRPRIEDLRGVDSDAESLGKITNPILSTAIEMASLGWTEQALSLFRKSREDSSGLFEDRRARLGEADCLVRLKKSDQARPIYEELIRTSTVGIAEELVTSIRLLRDEGEWEAVGALLRQTLDTVPLPWATESWARDLLARTLPMTRLTRKVVCIPAEAYDPSYLCRHALKVPGTGDGKGFVLTTDGARRSVFGRLIDYDGGPFRMEAKVRFHRLDWTAFFHLGLFRLSRVGTITHTPRYFFLEADPGRCTNVPAMAISLKAHGLGSFPGKLTLREYPQGFPTDYTFIFEYAPLLGRMSLLIRDETRDKEWMRIGRVTSRLPAGKYVLAVGGSCERASSQFQGRFTVESFELYTGSKNTKPALWEPEPGAFALLRAGGALALGDFAKAVELAGQVTPDTPRYTDTVSIDHWRVRGSDPLFPAAAKVVEAAARLRSGDEPGFEKALAQALERDAAAVFWYISRSFDGLSEKEKTAFGRVLRKVLLAGKGELFVKLLTTWRTQKNRRPRDLGGVRPGSLEAMEKAVRQAGESGRSEVLLDVAFRVLSILARPSLMEWFFLDTPFASKGRYQHLLGEALEFVQSGDPHSALPLFETLLSEFPDNAKGLNAAAWFLATAQAQELRDFKKAVELSRKSVRMARKRDSPFHRELSLYLDTLARALFACGRHKDAIRTQEEAVSFLGPGLKHLRSDFENTLQRYRRLFLDKKKK